MCSGLCCQYVYLAARYKNPVDGTWDLVLRVE